MSEDLYKILGVSRNASEDEIRKAYKKLARENHPDVKPDDKAAAERFREVQEAYAVLGDKEKREQYDQFGKTFRGGPRTWNTGSGPVDLGDIFSGQFGDGGASIDLGDLFGGAFGGGGGGGRRSRQPQPRRPSKGQNRQAEITVPFQVAAEGGKHELPASVGGHGEKLAVTIPAGIASGKSIRLAGQGQPGQHGGPSGDLLVKVNVAPHPYFRREGNNVLIDVPITVSEAALGAKIEVPTISEGNVVVTIPPGASSGTKLRLREKGFPDQKTRQRGDQLVVVKIAIPDELSDHARELLEQLAEEAPMKPRDELW